MAIKINQERTEMIYLPILEGWRGLVGGTVFALMTLGSIKGFWCEISSLAIAVREIPPRKSRPGRQLGLY